MTSRKFIYIIITITLIAIVSITLSSIWLNDFGLWSNRNNIKIHGLEKTSKYLLSFKYIPKNFAGIIIGPSASANMNTQLITNYKIYNLSMDGGNISELKFATDNVLTSNKIKYLIICLYPYLTQNHGTKGNEIDPKEYWGSILSFLPLKILLCKIRTKLFPNTDKFHSSTWGYNDANILRAHKPPGTTYNLSFMPTIQKNPDPIYIDPIAYNELRDVVNLARKNNVRILAYYYPIFYNAHINQKYNGTWDKYKNKISQLFTDADLVWDMNDPEYYYITRNPVSYYDGCHLNYTAAIQVLKVIETKLDAL